MIEDRPFTYKRMGFTGTRQGMTGAQQASFEALVLEYKPTEFREGDCTGSDDEATDIVARVSPSTIICSHPSTNKTSRANNTKAHKLLPPKDSLARNRDIVILTTFLVATPHLPKEQRRSGTWYTIRYAFSRKRPIILIMPNGSFQRYDLLTEQT